jgi:hypothetical protein
MEKLKVIDVQNGAERDERQQRRSHDQQRATINSERRSTGATINNDIGWCVLATSERRAPSYGRLTGPARMPPGRVAQPRRLRARARRPLPAGRSTCLRPRSMPQPSLSRTSLPPAGDRRPRPLTGLPRRCFCRAARRAPCVRASARTSPRRAGRPRSKVHPTTCATRRSVPSLPPSALRPPIPQGACGTRCPRARAHSSSRQAELSSGRHRPSSL